MANIMRREERTPSRATSGGGYFDPFRVFREMMRFDPFRDLESYVRGYEEGGIGWSPSFDVKETGDGLLIRADLPGVKDKDVNVGLTGNRLTISGKREEERREGEHYHTYERTYGAFERTFTLPATVCWTWMPTRTRPRSR